MKSNKKLYKNEIEETLRSYSMVMWVEEFLKNMVHVGFGVEQIKRGLVPFDYKFYSKDKRFLKQFIKTLKEISKNQDDVFSISERNNYYFISCRRKKYGCKQVTIYKGDYQEADDFFDDVDLVHDFNYLAYDYDENKITAKNMNLLEYRVANYNNSDDDFNWFKEIFCEDTGGEWASCEDLSCNPIKKRCFRKNENNLWEVYYV